MDYYQAVMQLRKGGMIHPLYIFSGPEDYLKEEFLQELLKQLKEKGKVFFLERLDGGQVNLAELMSEIKQTTLFSGGRLLWISNPPYFVAVQKKGNVSGEKEKVLASRQRANSQQGEKELLDFLQQKVSDAIIIFSVPNVDRRKKIVKLFEEAGALIDFSPLKGMLLKRWLREQFLKEKKKIEEEAIDELVERLGEDLYLQKREIEKIITYIGNEEAVNRALVRHLVPESRQGNIFKLVEYLGQKNLKGSLEHLHKLYRQNEHPLVILSMVARQFRLLYQFLILQEKGLSQREIAPFLKVQPFVARELAIQAKKYERRTIAGIIAHLKKMDMDIKTGRLEAADALEQCILTLTASGSGKQ